MKLCKDCKYCKIVSLAATDFSECHHPKNMKLDYATGDYKLNYKYCSTVRMAPWLISFLSRDCGKSARWFEEKT